MKRILRLGTALALLLALALAPATSGHNKFFDGNNNTCGGNGVAYIVVFDGANESGTGDDLCGNMPNNNTIQGDPNFSSNDFSWDDIGDSYLMDGFVSSASIHNYSTFYPLCVKFWPDPNYGGIAAYDLVQPGADLHVNFDWFYNDTIDSMTWYNQTYRNCSSF